jgi:predicted nucleic-acid-binding protein
VIALDTNVLVRVIAVEADADRATQLQQRQARALLSSGQSLYVPITVIEELEWVLRGVYEMPADEVAAVLGDLLAIENITVDRATAVALAVAAYRQGMDFSDALHLAQAGFCTELASFDMRFMKVARRLGLNPPVAKPAA